ncbi:MAG: ABC transporter ATP-binding protein [Deltaproteobacteria bacterium]|nr:ABC transporter ATP-binding protein [Deltaproteobacteria bacterium]
MSLWARVTARVGRLAIDVELDSAPGTLVLVGPNGAGKSSLLALLLGALPVERGRVAVGETVLLDTASGVDLPLEQRRLGYVPQDYALFPHLTVRENVAFALASAPTRLDRRARAQRVELILKDLGIETLGERRTQALSGGEKQRVALARALSVNPRALLLDEPLAAFDVHSRRDVREFLAGYLKELGLPTIVVSHDAADARQLGHRIAVLESGKIIQTGTWDELVALPGSRFVEELVTPPM